MTETDTYEGRVRDWHDDAGWGVIDCPDLPSPCWAHFSAIQMHGYHALTPGDAVTVEVEQVKQDGYVFRAVTVIPA